MDSSAEAAMTEVLSGPLHSVGDVIKQQYEIKEISKCERGKDSYLCKRASDEALFRIECLSLCHMIPPNRPDIFHESKTKLEKSRDSAESPICDSFELHIHGDTRFYVVRDASRQIGAAEQHSPRQPTSYLEPVERTGPAGMPCVVYRRGLYHLEIDIPARGLSTSYCATMTICVLPWALAPAAPLFLIGLFTGFFATWFCGLLYAIAALGLSAYWVIKSACGHINFVLTSQYFRQKRVLELQSRFRDSVNNPNAAEAKVTDMDQFFFGQLEGRTAALKEAKIEVTKDSRGNETRKVVVVVSSGQTHALRFNVSPDQQEWLVSEINTVLENIRGQTETV